MNPVNPREELEPDYWRLLATNCYISRAHSRHQTHVAETRDALLISLILTLLSSNVPRTVIVCEFVWRNLALALNCVSVMFYVVFGLLITETAGNFFSSYKLWLCLCSEGWGGNARFVGFYPPAGIQNVHESLLSWDNPEETLMPNEQREALQNRSSL